MAEGARNGKRITLARRVTMLAEQLEETTFPLQSPRIGRPFLPNDLPSKPGAEPVFMDPSARLREFREPGQGEGQAQEGQSAELP